MKIKVLIIVGTLLLLLAGQTVRAPELFGTGTMYRVGNHALIVKAPFLFVVTTYPCTIVQVAGPQIDDAEQPISCRIGNGIWRGWIEFRGHERAFCGAPKLADLPHKCRGDK